MNDAKYEPVLNLFAPPHRKRTTRRLEVESVEVSPDYKLTFRFRGGQTSWVRLTREMAKEVLHQAAATWPRPTPSRAAIISAVLAYSKTAAGKPPITLERLVSRDRTRHVVDARQLAMFLIRQIDRPPLAQIGAMFDRDHSTVIHALRAVQDRIDTEPYFVEQLRLVTAAL